MKELLRLIRNCNMCPLSELRMNHEDISMGYGALLPFYQGHYKDKIMLVGLNPSYRRFPDIFQAFGGLVPHEGSGAKFMKLLKELNLLDRIYITNLIKCSCSDNKPTQQMFKDCLAIFRQEVRMVRPTKIIALGRQTYDFLQQTKLQKIYYLNHPVYWSEYQKITKDEYSRRLCKLIM